MVMFMSIFGQFSGGGLGYFNTVIYNSLGYTKSAPFPFIREGAADVPIGRQPSLVSISALSLYPRHAR